LASILDKFKKSVIGSINIPQDYTPVIDQSGDFHRITGLNVVLNSWNDVLLTPVGTYDHDPAYGSNLYKYVFEPADITTSNAIKDEIKSCLSTYDDRASVSSIDVKFLKNGKGFSFNVFVEYNNQQGQLSGKIDESSYFNFSS
jgi:phage baseplate assembly protein W